MKKTSLDPADVFIDLENFSLQKEGHIRSIFEHLPSGLEALGLHPRFVFGAMSLSAIRFDGRYSYRDARQAKRSIERAFRLFGHTFTWTGGIADDAIKAEIVRKRDEGVLCRYVMLCTDDGDFAGITGDLRKAGHFVISCGQRASRLLEKEVDLCIPDEELLGYKHRGRRTLVIPPNVTLENRILFPQSPP